MQKFIAMGRLTADPEQKFTSNNIAMTRFTLAINRQGKPQDGQPTADFFNCLAWRNTAEFIEKYFRKGQQALIEGRIQNNNYTDKEGIKRYTVEVIVDQIYFADSKQSGTDSHKSASYGSMTTNEIKSVISEIESDMDLPF